MSIDTLELGRDAIRRHAWTEAMEAFSAADGADGLTAEDLELLGEAAWWGGHPDDAVAALERAFAGYVATERPLPAAGVAFRLAYLAFRRLAGSIGAGWLARAERLLENEPESAMHAWLQILYTVMAMMQSRLSDAIGHADRAMELAREHGNPDAHALALSFKGMAEIARGRWQDGLVLIDEAAAAAASGQLGIRYASDIYCNTIAACRDLGDYRRAGQWTDEAERWMLRESAGGYPGICRVHRAELKMMRGRWPEAEQEARQACDELELFRLMDGLGYAHYEVGEVRLRMGDLRAATEAFDRAYEYGHDAQPGLSRLQLAKGDPEEAARSIARSLAALAGTGGAPLAWRARLLPSQVEIALAMGDIETARTAVEELELIAPEFDQQPFMAAALTARGQLLLEQGQHAEAMPILAQAWRLWQEIDLPYESARARVLYGRALLADGDEVTARRDLRAARAVFERLGASLDLQQVRQLLGDDEGPSAAATARAQKTFMFTDIVTSTDLVGLIGDQGWDELLRWHDRELRASFAHHRGEEVKQTGDGFFVAFERAGDGVDCAVDIQRRLARHRKEHGFAPWVRIGLHAAEATKVGADYSGRGVHVAARIGGAADREEILISEAVLAAMGQTRFAISEPRSLSLKGVKEPVEVRTVDWR
ncbi:MAG: adenylate/guanylate cyclase domain-containing protein [Candidatus Limnocylindrales bacterium]